MNLHVLELASIPNKCMQCCLFFFFFFLIMKAALRFFCVGFPAALSHAHKITSQLYVIELLFSVNENHAE